MPHSRAALLGWSLQIALSPLFAPPQATSPTAAGPARAQAPVTSLERPLVARLELRARERGLAVTTPREVVLGCPRGTVSAAGYAADLRGVELLASRPQAHNLWRFALAPSGRGTGRARLALRCLAARLPAGSRASLIAAERFRPLAPDGAALRERAACPAGYLASAAGFERAEPTLRIESLTAGPTFVDFRLRLAQPPDPADGAPARIGTVSVRCLPGAIRAVIRGRVTRIPLATVDVERSASAGRAGRLRLARRCPQGRTALASFAEAPGGGEVLPLLPRRNEGAVVARGARVRLVVRCL